MASTVDGLRLRAMLGRDEWRAPVPWRPDGWAIVRQDRTANIIVTCRREHDDAEWVHASISRPHRMPDYDDLVTLHRAAFHDTWAYQVFAPRAHHINIHERTLHLWGRLDGAPVLPDFVRDGEI
jgi:hypothetical protein